MDIFYFFNATPLPRWTAPQGRTSGMDPRAECSPSEPHPTFWIPPSSPDLDKVTPASPSPSLFWFDPTTFSARLYARLRTNLATAGPSVFRYLLPPEWFAGSYQDTYLQPRAFERRYEPGPRTGSNIRALYPSLGTGLLRCTTGVTCFARS